MTGHECQFWLAFRCVYVCKFDYVCLNEALAAMTQKKQMAAEGLGTGTPIRL